MCCTQTSLWLLRAGQSEVAGEQNHTEILPPPPGIRAQKEDRWRPGLRVRRVGNPAHLPGLPNSHTEPHQSRGPQVQNPLLRPRGRSLHRLGTRKNGKTENRSTLRGRDKSPRTEPEEERNQCGNRKRRRNRREKPSGTHSKQGVEGNRKTGKNPGRYPGSGCGQTLEKRPPGQSPELPALHKTRGETGGLSPVESRPTPE